MQQVWSAITGWIIAQLFPWARERFILSISKTTEEVFENTAKNLLPQIYRTEKDPPKDENVPDLTSEHATERVYAASHLLRSYSIIGFIELAAWTSQMICVYLLIAKWFDWVTHMGQNRKDKEEK